HFAERRAFLVAVSRRVVSNVKLPIHRKGIQLAVEGTIPIDKGDTHLGPEFPLTLASNHVNKLHLSFFHLSISLLPDLRVLRGVLAGEEIKSRTRAKVASSCFPGGSEQNRKRATCPRWRVEISARSTTR